MSFIFMRNTLASTVLASSFCSASLPKAAASQALSPSAFASVQAQKLLKGLGAGDPLLKINEVAIPHMTKILQSAMVQGMASGTLTRRQWDERYMKADALYIYQLGEQLSERVRREADDAAHDGEESHLMAELAQMFLGYGKHFERLQKYGLTPQHRLVSAACERHIDFLTRETSRDEFFIAILTDMIPYVVLANYLLHTIDSDGNPWLSYAQKYGDLDGKYARERLAKTIAVANRILLRQSITIERCQQLFRRGFAFEEWFIRRAFAEGHTITRPLSRQ